MPTPYQGPATDPSTQLAAISLSDTVDVTVVARALYVGTGGNLAVIAAGDTAAVTLYNVPSGSTLPIRVKRVMATGTSASNVVALY